MDAALWGLIGTLVGAIASIATTWISTRNAHSLQASKIREERTEVAKAFQRDTLIALQEAVHDALRLNARAHLEQSMAFRQSQKWVKFALTEEVDEGIRLANRRISVLVERVADDSLRLAVKALIASATAGRFLPSEQEAELHLQKLGGETEVLFAKIGVSLRSNY